MEPSSVGISYQMIKNFALRNSAPQMRRVSDIFLCICECILSGAFFVSWEIPLEFPMKQKQRRTALRPDTDGRAEQRLWYFGL
jgi:hypothetical protein